MKPSLKTQDHKAGKLQLVTGPAKETVTLLSKSGEIEAGSNLITSILALTLGFLSCLAVLAFHFPEYLTTPELRQKYSVELLRYILFGALLLSGGLSIANIALNKNRMLNRVAFFFVVVAVAFGGSRVPVGDFPDHTPYLGLDWFILDVLVSSAIFVVIEKLLPLYRSQPVFRLEWQTDMIYFAINHLLIGFMLFTVNFFIHQIFGNLTSLSIQSWISGISYFPQLLLCVLAADLMEYWTHRAYHEVPFLWRIHAVHHSVKVMDWLAGSRLHLCEIVITRVCIMGILYCLGFSKTVVDAYILIVGFQAILIHANVRIPWGPLKYLVVTPNFHHWHHSSDQEALDRNYAAHFAFLDYIFGTAVKSEREFPEKYGVLGDYMPEGYLKQITFPFIGKMK